MKILSIVFFLSITSCAFSHAYYFGFAEMQYNLLNQTLETTLVLSAHDVEEVMKKSGEISHDLEFLVNDSLTVQALSKRIDQEFQVSVSGKKVTFELLGFEVLKTGLLHIYLVSNPIEISDKIQIRFSSLMNEFPEQQNKLTFIYKQLKYTAVFLPAKQDALIELKK